MNKATLNYLVFLIFIGFSSSLNSMQSPAKAREKGKESEGKQEIPQPSTKDSRSSTSSSSRELPEHPIYRVPTEIWQEIGLNCFFSGNWKVLNEFNKIREQNYKEYVRNWTKKYSEPNDQDNNKLLDLQTWFKKKQEPRWKQIEEIYKEYLEPEEKRVMDFQTWFLKHYAAEKWPVNFTLNTLKKYTVWRKVNKYIDEFDIANIFNIKKAKFRFALAMYYPLPDSLKNILRPRIAKFIGDQIAHLITTNTKEAYLKILDSLPEKLKVQVKRYIMSVPQFKPYKTFGDEISCLAVKDGELYTGTIKGQVKKWNIETAKSKSIYRGSKSIIFIGFMGKKKEHLVICGSNTIRLWNPQKEYISETNMESPIQQIAITGKNNDKLIFGTQDKIIYLWDMTTFEKQELHQHNCHNYKNCKLKNLITTPDKAFFTLCHYYPTILVWDINTRECIKEIVPTIHQKTACLTLLNNNTLLSCGWPKEGESENVEIHDLGLDKVSQTIKINKDANHCIVMGDKIISSGTYKKHLFIHDIISGEKFRLHGEETKAIIKINKQMFASLNNGTIFIWELPTFDSAIEHIIREKAKRNL